MVQILSKEMDILVKSEEESHLISIYSYFIKLKILWIENNYNGVNYPI